MATDAAVHAGASRAAFRVARVRALLDGTPVLQARRLGRARLAANVVDLDCLQRIGPEGRVLFYEAA
ncbi:hypothetical protein DK419_27205 [Methylobacterium terrae]|uniref:Uncharacterized protein n=1 Tax=Methylobacterium terrae TaxID=2202827 RepID=A0A2U8WVU7_9HYPH|nr:hypothetical protein [Methylobacterium terrae]AWN49570.1 hypothetical protein DK419_27205 [Methylobacterium terrae]